MDGLDTYMKSIDRTYNPLNYSLELLDYFDLKYGMDDPDPVEEVAKIIEMNPKIVAWQCGFEAIDFMMNQYTIRLFVVNDIPVNEN